MKKVIGCAALLLMVATAAGAKDKDKDGTKAPEIDPASAITALTMLAAGVAVLRGRGAKAS
jgi:hypothetical protein